MTTNLSNTANISKNWPAPAKLNLFLHITGQRADGYHELQTLFQFVDQCDYLDFLPTEDKSIRLHSELSKVVAEKDNLILKAAKSLQEYCNYQGGAEIWLRKNLPMGGGLGGGSSDAATTLIALNKLWQLNLPQQTLAEIGLKLGADVPVFINGFAAFAEGVGERLVNVQPAELYYLVIVPNVHVSTQAIFQDPLLPRNTPKLLIDTLMDNKWTNDCQSLVAEKHPQVANALSWLVEYAPSRMTGTGACVFGEFEQQQTALDALAKLPKSMQGFVAKGLNQSPLLTRLSQS